MPSRNKNRIIRVAVFAFVLNAAGGLGRAVEPVLSVELQAEQEALASDSASGLMAAGHPQKFLGARSCAAAACHGGIDPDPRFLLSRRNEYVDWLDKDPHARGYQTLKNDLSAAILDRLSHDVASRAKRLANCYGCHNPQPPPAQRAASFYERDSVGCEICHGPAEKWIGAHVTTAWPGQNKTALGFIDTESVTIRAQTCAACHVGSPGREVNHDLIAAGHPALKFELTAYHAMLSKHWRDDRERKLKPLLEITLWQAGQVACGEAAIDLLKWRAQRAENEAPDAVWPEFAEYDCYACHHDLVHPSWRQTSSTSSVPLGMPAWGSWYFRRLKQPAGKSLQALADEMQGSFRPDPTAIIEVANSLQLAAPAIEADIREPANWDDATQQYLGLVAFEQAQRDAGKSVDAALTAGIKSLREQLAFPRDYDSPRGIFEERDSSVTRDQVHQSLLELMKQLQRRGKD
jgi:hypothetical protein